MTLKNFSSVFLTAAIFFVFTLAQPDTNYNSKLTLITAAAAQTNSEAYVLTVPEDFTINNSGWNALGEITVTRSNDMTFSSGKKLVVTADSENNWQLKSNNSDVGIAYTLKTASTQSEATTSFTFWEQKINSSGGASQEIGIDVANYDSVDPGKYQDNITYTAEVKNTTQKNVTFSTSSDGTTINKEGVTCSQSIEDYDAGSYTIYNLYAGTFSVSSGQFTKIEVTASDVGLVGGNMGDEIAGWSVGSSTATWTGSASSVEFGDITSMGDAITIVFTIEE